jgi:hypothetical protein
MTINIERLDESESSILYSKYPGQNSPQGCYLELDPDKHTVCCGIDAEIGNSTPMPVYQNLPRSAPTKHVSVGWW